MSGDSRVQYGNRTGSRTLARREGPAEAPTHPCRAGSRGQCHSVHDSTLGKNQMLITEGGAGNGRGTLSWRSGQGGATGRFIFRLEKVKLKKHKPDTFWPRDRKRFEAGVSSPGNTARSASGKLPTGEGGAGQGSDMPDVVTRESVRAVCTVRVRVQARAGRAPAASGTLVSSP